MVRGTRADATWHPRPRGRAARALVAEPHEPTQRAGGADAWQGHTSPRARPGGATWR